MTIKTKILCSSAAALLVAGCGGTAKTPPASQAPVSAVTVEPDAGPPEAAALHADVVAFILTRCPYAAEAMRSLLALKREMGRALALSIGYIGLVDAEGNIDPSVGGPEIAAARMQICVGITSDDAEWLDYLECVYEGERWRSMPDGFDECSDRAGIDRGQVIDCIDSGDGDAILAQAYGAATTSHIVSSPTIIIDGYLYNGGKTVADLRQHICYGAGSPTTRPPACGGVAPPPEIAATMLYDERCDDAALCDVETEMSVLEKLVPGLKLARVPFASEEGQKLYGLITRTELGIAELPMVIIDRALDEQPWVKELFGESLLSFGKGYVLALGRGWDPTAEICDNRIDDNGDGETDCSESSCSETLVCREEKPRQLDLFIMSGCPFATEMMPNVDRLIVHFEKSRKALDLRLQFIGDVEGDTLTSMHGPEEVEEDLRMVCAQKHYGKDYKFMEYVLCRAASAGSPAWEACVPKGMSKKKLEKCTSGAEGKALLRASFELADRIGVTGSPTLILNNKSVLNARELGEMIAGFCEKNESARCEVPVEDEPARDAPMSDLQCH